MASLAGFFYIGDWGSYPDQALSANFLTILLHNPVNSEVEKGVQLK